MANTLISTLTNHISTLNIGSSEYFVLLQGVGYTNTASTAIDVGSNADVLINGDFVHLGSVYAVRGGSDDTNVRVQVGATGSLTSVSATAQVELSGNSATFVNDGYTSLSAISLYGDNTRIVNTGTFVGTDSSPTALFANGANASIVNSGTLTADRGIVVGTGGEVSNTGTIQTTIIGVRLGNNSTLHNSGVIETTRFQAVFGSNETDTVINSGTIIGEVDLSSGEDVMRNSGDILGDVDLGNGNDSFRAFGDARVSGDVNGGEGNDELTGGTGEDAFLGADGDDTLAGRAGDDTLMGGAGNDRLDGGDGNDLLDGGNFADTIKGKNGDDIVLGDNGADMISGGSGNDSLSGGNGADSLWGGLGEDTLEGGVAADMFWGGGDADVFVLNAVSESTNSGADRIRDFEQGLDRIDLSDLGDLEFVGNAGFAGGGQASVRYVRFGGQDRTEVRIDADGNGSQDGLILLDGAMNLTASDFLL